ncbi:para-aminobenzoate synthase [Lecanosticta acicola]|uniref:aminodeoxychorismate synthase n=1 Tax=Lecanosticta acicola TaxID=111012 RepID=A0AAI8Z512_9PEZI|nr:para-aminobenzoate synthase [Lecanosticta acicola]
MQHPKILFIDAYDSFSNSIIALLRAQLPVIVESVRIDDQRFVLNDEAFYSYLDGFHAVVAGPGPGHPAKSEDVGLIGKIWRVPQENTIPVLGICLGFQSLCHAFGGKVARLREPRHGIMAIVEHDEEDVFAGARKIVATQYHSLHIRLDEADFASWTSDQYWTPSLTCPDLKPLAWDLMNVANGPILMAARHCEKPFWGVQYHPESICTNKEGQKLVGKWWEEACAWRALHRKTVSQPVVDENKALPKAEGWKAAERLASLPGRKVAWKIIETKATRLDVADVVDLLRKELICEEPLLLESGTRSNGKPVNPETGRFSIIGLPDSSSMHIRYSTCNHTLDVIHDGEIALRRPLNVHEAFTHIDEHMRSQTAVNGPNGSPFWGGLIGFISYEAGLETIDVPPSAAKSERPDIWFVFVERSVVVDHVAGTVYVQSVRMDDDEWMKKVVSLLRRPIPSSGDGAKITASLLDGPEKDEYCQKVRDCQSQLRAGESYELCLTDQSTIQVPADGWSLYRQLRSRNPAPFGAYLRLQSKIGPGVSVAGSSPERFLSWSRAGKCQFRPIKGTVKKAPGVTRAKAEEILGSAKERAENLMIVDLIRHDLAGVLGGNAVRVPKLMSIEEYETVFQLVSVVEGDLDENTSGSAALAASLPPGSMTGAPKKRSCELLKEIEGGKPRGLYSGVIGFFDVRGGGDFSVVIRTAFRWDDEDEGEWKIGAGGAITALSEAEAEWEEMVTKRESVLNALL